LNLLGIECHEDFAQQLHRWPWVEDWHPTHTQVVWSALTAMTEEVAEQQPHSQIFAAPGTPPRSEERLFLGGLEFYNGS
jgi:hypothetical protein